MVQGRVKSLGETAVCKWLSTSLGLKTTCYNDCHTQQSFLEKLIVSIKGTVAILINIRAFPHKISHQGYRLRSLCKVPCKTSTYIQKEEFMGTRRYGVYLNCSTRCLTTESSEWERYWVEHKKRNSLPPSNHVLLCY